MSPSAQPAPESCARPDSVALSVNGARLMADAGGALLWPEEGLLAVADLHLEKGSGFAAKGRFLPPYDTRATLDRLAALVERHRPRRVAALGDSFHDRTAALRMDDADRERLRHLAAGVEDWVWITGNHDPAPPEGLGGRSAPALALGPLLFRHDPMAGGAAGEVAGHLHPVAAVRTQGRRVRDRCFATDGRRLVLPAFGAYAGGLNVLDPAVRGLFPAGFAVLMSHGGRLHRFPHDRLSPDR